MRAILVCVDFADILAVTLPWNRHHFDEVMVVTTPGDKATHRLCVNYGARLFATDAFYEDGARFNKGRALAQGLEAFGLDGWMCIMDADVMWPQVINQAYIVGNLYSPFRRMMTDITQPIPPESQWLQFPLHPYTAEWAGYTQIFHADDPVLRGGVLFEIDWKHAGGYDSRFERRWHWSRKIRPNWECLHLGEDGKNWCGRATQLMDGTIPSESAERIAALEEFKRIRQQTGSFEGEKLVPRTTEGLI